jgi:hypothetical protein
MIVQLFVLRLLLPHSTELISYSTHTNFSTLFATRRELYEGMKCIHLLCSNNNALSTTKAITHGKSWHSKCKVEVKSRRWRLIN